MDRVRNTRWAHVSRERGILDNATCSVVLSKKKALLANVGYLNMNTVHSCGLLYLQIS